MIILYNPYYIIMNYNDLGKKESVVIDWVQMLDLADKNIKAAIVNMSKELKEYMMTIIQQIGTLSKEIETLKMKWNS